MTKYIYASLALGLILVSGNAMADEVTRSTSTRVDSPDQSSRSNTTTTTTNENTPTAVNQESTTTETAPGVQRQVSTKKKYYVSKPQKTVVRHSESETVR